MMRGALGVLGERRCCGVPVFSADEVTTLSRVSEGEVKGKRKQLTGDTLLGL